MLWQIRYGLCVGSHIVPPPCGAALSTDDAAHHQSPSRLQCKTVCVWKLREVSKKFYSVDVKILVFTYYFSLKKERGGQDHLQRNWICPAVINPKKWLFIPISDQYSLHFFVHRPLFWSIFYKILKTFFFIEKTFQIFPSPRCSYPSLTLSERCKDQFANGTQGSNQQWKSTNAQNGIANLFIGYFCPAPKAIFFVVDWEL